MKEKLGLNPWLSVWARPKETIRKVLNYKLNHCFAILCGIYGFQYSLHLAQFYSLGLDYSLLAILIASLVLSIPMGYILFNLSAFFLFLTGKLIKGKGSFKEIRAAVSWTAVPSIIAIGVWIGLVLMNGGAVFVSGYEQSLVGTGQLICTFALIPLVVLGIWAVVIMLHMLGEVQGFSAWMALLNSFLSGLLICILTFLILWGGSALTHAQ